MKSVYPESVVRTVLRRLDTLDVLEFIDYQTHQMVRDPVRVRMCCPIHHGHNGRTLTVHLERRHYECSEPTCPGAPGGDLIELIARSRGCHYDTALRQLVDEFQLDVRLPSNPEALQAAMVEAENSLELVATDPARRDRHLKIIKEGLERILGENPHHVAALRMRIRYLAEMGDIEGRTNAVLALAEAEERAGNPAGAQNILREELEVRPTALPIRRRLAEMLREVGRSDEALQEYLSLAESAEARGDLGQALQAYRRIQLLGDVGFDAGALIAQLLMATNNPKEAARELIQQAYRYREQGNITEAIDALESAHELEPDNHGISGQLVEMYAARGARDGERDLAMTIIANLEEKGALKEAIVALESLTRALPDDIELLDWHGRQLENQGRASDAEAVRRHLAELYERTGDAASWERSTHRLAESHAARGEIGAVRKMLDQMRARKLRDLEPYERLLMIVLESEPDGEERAKDLRRYYAMCDESKRLEPAAAFLEQLVAEFPADPASRELLAEACGALGHHQERINHLLALLSIHEQRADGVRALDVHRKLLALRPEDTNLRRAGARTLARLGITDEAVECMLDLALLQRTANRLDSALATCEECLAIGPAHLGALSLRAELLEQLGHAEQALAEWRALAPRVRQLAVDYRRLARKRGRNAPDTGFE